MTAVDATAKALENATISKTKELKGVRTCTPRAVEAGLRNQNTY
jgi:hypothetical protein